MKIHHTLAVMKQELFLACYNFITYLQRDRFKQLTLEVGPVDQEPQKKQVEKYRLPMSTTQWVEIKEDGFLKRCYKKLTGMTRRTMYVYRKDTDGKKELLNAYDTQTKDLGTWEWSNVKEAGEAMGAVLGPFGEFVNNVIPSINA